MYRVLIAEKEEFYIHNYYTRLGNRKDFEIIGIVSSFQGIIEFLSNSNPHCILLNLSILIEDYKNNIIKIKQSSNSKLIVTYGEATIKTIKKLLSYGVNGIYQKDTNNNDFLNGLYIVMNEGLFIDSFTLKNIFNFHQVKDKDPFDCLTKREREIVTMFGSCLSAKEIASILHISVKTIYNHRTNIMSKLGIISTDRFMIITFTECR